MPRRQNLKELSIGKHKSTTNINIASVLHFKKNKTVKSSTKSILWVRIWHLV